MIDSVDFSVDFRYPHHRRAFSDQQRDTWHSEGILWRLLHIIGEKGGKETPPNFRHFSPFLPQSCDVPTFGVL